MNILLYNAKVLTQDSRIPKANSVYISGKEIKYVGELNKIKEKIANKAIEINLRGNLIIPGFTDSHTHFVRYALAKNEINLSNVTNTNEIKGLLKEFKEKSKKDVNWIKGTGWQKYKIKDFAKLDRFLIDEIFSETPVVLGSKDSHTYVCNSKVIELLNLTKDTKLPPGISIGYFPSGTPNGFLYENACQMLNDIKPGLPEHIQKKLLKQAITQAHKFGITAIHVMENENEYLLLREMKRSKELKLRICWHFPLKILDEMISREINSYSGDEWIKIGGVKLFMDGALGSQTAYMYHHYLDNSHNYGYLVRDEKEFLDLIVKAGKNNISTSTHAIGDKCNSIVINSIIKSKTIPELRGKNLFHRIEHLQCVLPKDQKKIGNYNIYASVQPIHLSSDIKIIEKYLGKYGKNSYPFRSLIDNGAILGFGSDVPIASNNPFLGIYAAVERRFENDLEESSWCPQQKISIEEAIKAYTIWGAHGAKNEKILGSITPGKLADIIVIPDYNKKENEFFLQAKSLLTIVNGEIVYNSLYKH